MLDVDSEKSELMLNFTITTKAILTFTIFLYTVLVEF